MAVGLGLGTPTAPGTGEVSCGSLAFPCPPISEKQPQRVEPPPFASLPTVEATDLIDGWGFRFCVNNLRRVEHPPLGSSDPTIEVTDLVKPFV